MTGVSRGLHRTGIAIAAIGTATAGFGALAVRSTAQFAESMQKVVGLSGVAQGKIAGLTDEVLKLAPAVGRSPQELANALFFITSSGIKASDAIDVLTVSAKASVAGLGETQVVADAVTSAMNAYGAANLNAKAATDVLVATVREGKGEASAFAGVLGNVIPIASQLGVSFNEVGAALAAQTRLGTSAETATIQLQAVFSGLLKSTPKTAKAFASVGLNIDDLRKQLTEKGLLSVLDTLKTSFGDNTKAMANAFGNVRALRGVLALVGKQADQVRGVFNRMRDSTSALGIAFGAVSKDTAQQFRKAQAAAQVAVIQIGAALAPLAGVVARGLTAGATAVTDFVEKLSAATSFSAKLDVVFTGVGEVARRLQVAIGNAVAAVDFDAVWARARGIADGLQKRLEEIDFSLVGERIGEGIADAVKFAIPAAKDLAARITDAVLAIDFVKIGKAAGPGLAAAIATAFVTLLDPAFWLKNWQLALSVALAVIPIGRFAKIGEVIVLAIARPLERIAPRLALALLTPLRSLGGLATRAFEGIASGIGRVIPLIGAIVERGFRAIPGLILRALSPLTGLVSRLFGRLGKIAQFAVKVTGIAIVINAVTGLVRRIGSIFGGLGHSIAKAFGNAMRAVQRIALETALKILKALDFTIFGVHVIPGVHSLVKNIEGQLDHLAAHTATTTARMQASIDRLHGKNITITTTHVEESKGRGGIAPGPEGVTAPKIPSLASVFAGIGHQVSSLAATTAKTTKDVATTQTDSHNKVAAAAKNAADKAKTAFARMLSTLQIGLQKAQLTPQLQDDIKAEKAIISALQQRLKITKNDLDLQAQLVTEQGNLLAIQKQQKDALREAIDSARQRFGTLFQVPDVATAATALGGTRGRQVVPGTGTDAAGLKKNLDAQITAFRQVTQNIAFLVRRGAPPELVRAARAGELTPQQINTLAHANKTTLQAIFRDVRIADKLVAHSARMDVKTPHVTLRAQRVNITGIGNVRPLAESGGRTSIHIDHVTIQARDAADASKLGAELERKAKRRGNQRRGRVGGHR